MGAVATMTRDRVAGVAMILGTSASIQLSAAVAHSLFSTLGPTGVSALRFALGAAIVLPLVRPRLRGRDRAAWRAIAAYGISLAALNLTFFEAIARLQLGLAVTFAFVAPVAVALAGSRRRRDAVYALVAGAGVVVLGGVDRPHSTAGVAYAVAAGCAWAGVAFAGRSVGRRTRRLDGLALAIVVACVVTLPFGAGRAGALDARSLGVGVAIAAGGLIVPFALELEGLRRLEPRLVAVVYSCDPAIGAVVGLVVLSQPLRPAQAAGIAAVVSASALATAATPTAEPVGFAVPAGEVSRSA
jgi:inner membrane transporter RhtA